MALPSQQQRGGGMGPRLTGGRSRHRRRNSRRLLGVVLLLAVVGLVVWQWPSIMGGPDEANAKDTDRAVKTTQTDSDTGPPELVVQNPGGFPFTPTTTDRGTRPQSNTPSGGNGLTMGENRGAHRRPDPVDQRRDAPATEDKPAPRPVQPPTNNAGIGLTGAVRDAIERAEADLKANRPVEARDTLNRVLYAGGINATDADHLRSKLSEISQRLTFSPRAYPGDEMVDTYTVKSGDVLSAIPRRSGYGVDYRLIQRINAISDPSRIRVGQKLKVIKGPIHAVVDKSAFRLDLYADQTDSAGNRLYIRSFPVGLGEFGTTPLGDWVVREGGKVVNPAWVNPRTGEKFSKDDPDIPIGERWIALRGTDSETELLDGYGIHGTNEPESIGLEMSMGCVRMLAPDIELIYEMLTEGDSTIRIVE